MGDISLYCDHISHLDPDFFLVSSIVIRVSSPLSLKHPTNRDSIVKMKSAILTAALFASASLAWLPSCADTCISNWDGNSCTSSSGWSCLCGNSTAIANINSCVASSCSDSTDRECEQFPLHHPVSATTNMRSSNLRCPRPDLRKCRRDRDRHTRGYLLCHVRRQRLAFTIHLRWAMGHQQCSLVFIHQPDRYRSSRRPQWLGRKWSLGRTRRTRRTWRPWTRWPRRFRSSLDIWRSIQRWMWSMVVVEWSLGPVEPVDRNLVCLQQFDSFAFASHNYNHRCRQGCNRYDLRGSGRIGYSDSYLCLGECCPCCHSDGSRWCDGGRSYWRRCCAVSGSTVRLSDLDLHSVGNW